MRDLSATNLESEQQKMSVEPVVSFVFTGASTYTYDTDRFLRVLHSEEPSSHKAEIILQNADGVLTTKTLKGYQVASSWGLKTSAGNETSKTAPLWVRDQRLDSLRGRMICTLSCIGIPDRLAEDKANDNYSHHWSSVKTVKDLITEIADGQPVEEELTEEITEVDGYINLDDTVVEWTEEYDTYTGAIHTNASAGATSLALDSLGTGTILKNTKLQIAGADDSIYYVTADVAIVANEATVSIDLKLAFNATATAVVTLTNPSSGESSVLHGAGQRLNIPNRTVTKLAFRLKKTGSPADTNVTFKIVDVATYSVLASKTFPISSITTSPAWCEVTLDSPLLVNEDVWIYCEHTAGTATNYVSVNYYSKDWKLNQNIVRIFATGSPSPSWETVDEECACRYKYTYAGISVWNHPVQPCATWPVVYDNDTTGSLLSTYVPADAFYIREGESRLDVLDRLLAYTDCERMFKAATIAQPSGSIHILVPTISGATWVANTAYLLNSYVQPTTPNNNFTYRCTTAGTSSATTEPTWPTTAGLTVGDGAGALVWTCVDHDYEYALTTGHTFFSKANREALVIPNRIVVKSLEDDETQYTGEATSAASYALLPITGSPIRTRLSDNPQGTSIAKAYISRLEVTSQRGSASVPMNVGAEQWDYVKVTDERQSDFRIGNIGYLSRLYQPGIYQMTFGFGGVAVKKVPGTQLSSLKSEISEYDALYAPDIPAKWGILLPHLRKYAEAIDKLQQAISDVLIGIDFYDNQLSTDTKIDNALIGLATIEYVNSHGMDKASTTTDVFSSRSLGVAGSPQVFQNTTGYPLLVVVSVGLTTGGDCSAYASASADPTDILIAEVKNGNLAPDIKSMTFIVDPSFYYEIWNYSGGGTVTKSAWSETTLGT